MLTRTFISYHSLLSLSTVFLLFHFSKYTALTFCNCYILSLLSFLVNYFFYFFVFLHNWQKIKRRRRDLNPRAAINDLHPFQGCPFGQLGYFSIAARTRAIFGYTLEKEFLRILFACFLVSPPSGEDGIRTHAPLRTNGFQDRLVMTTSIPLHMYVPVEPEQNR